MHDLGDMLVAAGFAAPVMDMEMLTLAYRDADALLADLRASGQTSARADRPRGLAGRRFARARCARALGAEARRSRWSTATRGTRASASRDVEPDAENRACFQAHSLRARFRRM